MGAFAWVMMGIALWHFTIFLPDRCWAGIIGAFLGCLLGALAFGFVVNGFSVPGQDDTNVLTAMQGVPGAALGFGLFYLIGARQEAAAERDEDDLLAT